MPYNCLEDRFVAKWAILSKTAFSIVKPFRFYFTSEL